MSKTIGKESEKCYLM